MIWEWKRYHCEGRIGVDHIQNNWTGIFMIWDAEWDRFKASKRSASCVLLISIRDLAGVVYTVLCRAAWSSECRTTDCSYGDKSRGQHLGRMCKTVAEPV